MLVALRLEEAVRLEQEVELVLLSPVSPSPDWVRLEKVNLSAPELIESDLVQWMDPQFRKLLVAHVVDVHDPSIECAPPRSPR